jgi:branched-chain amino acid transport system ATP-binding protein
VEDDLHSKMLLSVRGICVSYRMSPVLQEVSLDLREGEIAAIVGPNGAGKTTLLKTISGLLPPERGHVIFKGEPLERRPVWEVVARGLVYVPEGMRVFADMSVVENLEVGAYLNRGVIAERLTMIFDLFPELRNRKETRARFLSGGEQRMVTLARGLMSGAKLLLLDDPFQGLSPKSIERFSEAFGTLRANGVTLFLAGQHVGRILALSDWGFLMENGAISLSGPSREFLQDTHLQQILFGVERSQGTFRPI